MSTGLEYERMDNRIDEIRSVAFPTLTEDQIAFLKRYGEVRETEAGQVLFQEGDRSYDFIVILEGEVEIAENFEGKSRTIAVHGAGRFLGEMNMLTGQSVYLSAVGEGSMAVRFVHQYLADTGV